MGDPHAPLLHADKLEAAVTRPRFVAHYEDADLVRQAAVLAVAISQSQAFLEGNKRAAFAAADVFLRINGVVFAGEPLALARLLEAVAEAERGSPRDRAIERFEAYLRSSIVDAAGGPPPE